MGKNRSMFAEIWGFLKETKAWWLAPIIIMLIVVCSVMVFMQSSVLSQFVYALF